MRDNTLNLEFGFDIHSQEAIDSRFILTAYDMEQVGQHDNDPTSRYHTARFPEKYFALQIESDANDDFKPQLWVYDAANLNRGIDSEGRFIGAFTRVDYDYIKQHPYINDVEVVGHKSLDDYLIQRKLVAKEGIALNSEGDYDFIRAVVDGKTMVFNFAGELEAVIKNGVATEVVHDSEGNHVNVLVDDRTVKVANNKLEVPIDNLTIQINSEGKMVSMPEPLKNGIATEVKYVGRDETVNVLFDDATIKLNSEGKLFAVPEPLADGVATEVRYTSTGEETVNVRFDGLTVMLNSAGELMSVPEPLKDGIATKIRYEGRDEVVDVQVAGKTVFVNSEGKLDAQIKNAYASIHEVTGLRSDLQGYVYDTLYTGYDYADLDKYQVPVFPFNCTAVKNGNFYGRNLDWTYDEDAEFIVRTPRIGSRYATMGIASCIHLSKDFVRSGAYSDRYKLLPLMMCDGINEKGVVANTNVVPNDRGTTTASVPNGTVEMKLVSIGLIRFMLDNFATAREAAEYVRDHVEVRTTRTIAEQGFEQHFMVADANEAFVIEFLKDSTGVVRNVIKEQTCMTNFYENEVTFDANGKAYTPYTHSIGGPAATTQGIENHGCGLERWNLIKDRYASANTKAGMRALMNDLFYTKSYTLDNVGAPETFWFTEYTKDALTVDSDPVNFAAQIATDKAKFANRSRIATDPNFGTWQTTHSTVFDIANKNMSVVFQEDSTRVLEFEFDYYTKEKIDELLEANTSIDDVTIKRNADSELFVNIDDLTIKVNSEGKLSAIPEPLVEGRATDAVYDGRNEKVNVRTDDATVKVNADNKLFVPIDDSSITFNSEGKLIAKLAALAGEGIEIKSDDSINVKFDKSTLKLDSEGKLIADIDEKTLIIDSEGKIATRIGGWRKDTAGTQFNYTGDIIGAGHKTTSAWSGLYIPQAGNTIVCKVKVTNSEGVKNETCSFVMQDLGDGYITGQDTMHTLLDGIKFKKTRDFIVFSFDNTTCKVGDNFTVESIGVHMVYHKIDYRYIPIDDKTIVINDKHELSAVAKSLTAGEAINVDSEGKINVKFDNSTIMLNSEGNLFAVPEPLADGIATKVYYIGGVETVNVKFDNDSITLNSEGELITNANRLTLPVTTVSDIWHSLI